LIIFNVEVIMSLSRDHPEFEKSPYPSRKSI
jgi:hypothetical protein